MLKRRNERAIPAMGLSFRMNILRLDVFNMWIFFSGRVRSQVYGKSLQKSGFSGLAVILQSEQDTVAKASRSR